ncbi:MAG: hypothetical protein JKY52_11970 [Flavobacteriales bacterium]|nr:hypothetical protein [Flavobacteriales bacterium]
MLIEKINTGQAELWIEDHIYRLIHLKGKRGTLATAKEELRIHRELSGGMQLPLFADLRMMKNASPEARDYGNSEAVISTYAAVGILIGSNLTRIMGSMFIRINKPSYPVRMFTIEEDALAWLQQFK